MSLVHIAFILDGGLGGGGAERVAINLIGRWLCIGHKVTIITLRGPEHDFYDVPPLVNRIVLGGVCQSANKFMGLLNNIQRTFRLRRALKKSGADTVIAFGTRTNVRTVISSLGLGKRVIISERSDVSRQRFSWPWHLARRLLYRYADIVTANSRRSLRSMKGYVAEQCLKFTPNPLVVPKLHAVPNKSTIVLSVGRLIPLKQHTLIIHALSLLGEYAAEWDISILGEGPERTSLIKLADQLGVANRVFLQGLVADTSLYYLSAGLFVLPSLYEGMPNALFEAMSYGLPCIVSDSLPGALEYVIDRKTGLFFRSDSPTDLAEKMSVLIGSPELRVQLGTAARKSIQEHDRIGGMIGWNEIIPSR